MLNNKKEDIVFQEIKRLLRDGQTEDAMTVINNLFMSTGDFLDEVADYLGMSADLEENYLGNLNDLVGALNKINIKEKEMIKSVKISEVRKQLLGNN
ncbi:MAG: hypothetical protein WCF94_02710 [bacterium]